MGKIPTYTAQNFTIIAYIIYIHIWVRFVSEKRRKILNLSL